MADERKIVSFTLKYDCNALGRDLRQHYVLDDDEPFADLIKMLDKIELLPPPKR